MLYGTSPGVVTLGTGIMLIILELILREAVMRYEFYPILVRIKVGPGSDKNYWRMELKGVMMLVCLVVAVV